MARALGILWSRPWVFYAPNEYGGTDPTQFVKTLAAVRGGRIATKTADLPAEVKVVGNPDHFVLLFKATAAGWSKSTKAMDVGTGCIVQVSTEHLASDGTVSWARDRHSQLLTFFWRFIRRAVKTPSG
jgi:hypothetical protein